MCSDTRDALEGEIVGEREVMKVKPGRYIYKRGKNWGHSIRCMQLKSEWCIEVGIKKTDMFIFRALALADPTVREAFSSAFAWRSFSLF